MVRADLEYLWTAYWFLSSCRPSGYGAGAIPLSEIVTYWKELQGVYDLEELNILVGIIKAMDIVFLKDQSTKE